MIFGLHDTERIYDMKQVIYYNKTDGAYYMTPKSNYYDYIQDARLIHRLDGVKTLDDVYEMIDKFCKWYNDEPTNYELAKY